jgi:sterol desaturase/sphingolipid hydroxylase (fatty acid hydroxylase superfamily)
MAPSRLITLYLGELAELPKYFAVIFVLFAILAYGFACLRRRALLVAWRDIRDALAPREVYARRTVRFDIAIFWLQMLLVLPAITFVGSLYTADQFAKLLTATYGAAPITIGAGHPIAATLIQVQAALIFASFGAFIYHYAGHKVPMFWAIHKVHHSAEALSPFTAARGHPLDTLLGIAVGLVSRTLVVGAALYVTGGAFTPATLTVLSCAALASLVQDALNHSHVPLSYGWLNRIWVGPAFHHIHHSLDPRHRDKNFGGGVPIWDWMFGTMYLPDPDEALVLGLNDQEIGEANPHNSFKGYLIDPLAEFGREFAKLPRAVIAVLPRMATRLPPRQRLIG